MSRLKLSEEEKKRRKKEYDAKRYQEKRDKILEQCKIYRETHKEEKSEYHKKWYQENKEKKLEQNAEYYAEYNKTPIGRAVYLVKNYRREDKKANRGKCTLTGRWIVENIFPKPCHYCGKEGWDIIGCDRIDNSLPHTPDNVVPCCYGCNCKRCTKSYEEFKKEMEGI